MEDRFDNFVIPEPMSGCWLWDGGYSGSGYGRFNVRGKMVQAHRFSYERYVGAIPDDLFVCHRCDVRPCVNPDHLFVGTQSDNLRDMVAKGRDNPVCGEANWKARLTEVDVAAIRADARSLREIGIDYGIDKSYVWKIKRGWEWGNSWNGLHPVEFDRVKRGQQIRAHGEKHHQAKLTTPQITAIRSSALSARKLAALYAVSHRTILSIKNRKIWRSVP